MLQATVNLSLNDRPFLPPPDNLPTYKALQKMVTFSHRQGDRVDLRKFTKDGYFFSPAGRSKEFTQVYKSWLLFLTDRAIGVIYSLS
ncbi:MAG: hypothetical protein HC849_02565 [Oscillatoriales cyanobacterium RU_3_3]|nr:hypothetical protein [Oscillatoriales cyanobacterium RU_3_3]